MPQQILWLEWSNGTRPGRIAVDRLIRAGRNPSYEIPLVADPYASRDATLIQPEADCLLLDSRATRHGVLVQGKASPSAEVRAGQSFTLGSTTFHIVSGPRPDEDTKDFRSGTSPVFRRSVRELTSPEGMLIAQFSQGEATAFMVLATAYPNAASHDQVGDAVWGRDAYDRYQVHRLVQRVRVRMGEWGGSLSNVRGSGYRMSIQVRVE